MTFKLEDSAYDFYNKYAKRIGFSIIKRHLKRRANKSCVASILYATVKVKKVVIQHMRSRKKLLQQGRSSYEAEFNSMFLRKTLGYCRKLWSIIIILL
jgi:hypothetical protein